MTRLSGSSSPRNPPDNLLPLSDNEVLSHSLLAFFSDGYPHLDDFLTELSTYRVQFPNEANVFLFNVAGAFFYNLKENMVQHEMDLELSVSVAMNAVLGDPVVAGLVQSFMEGAVGNMVKRTLDE